MKMLKNTIMENDDTLTPYNWVKSGNIIKVIGVGGGGCNAVEHMFKLEDIKGADFIICNTDRQALAKNEVPFKIQLGNELTKGLGAGLDPLRGRKAAIESQDAIKEALGGKTEMVFVTCGMGGGTGTGAAPVIADIAHKMDLLTVAVVTLPFEDEGYETMSRAIEGIHEMSKCVDSLLIINNQKIYEVYGDLPIHEAFPKADEILATAVRGITEIIMDTGYINVDFADVKKTMKGSGLALMGSGRGNGENRIRDAVTQALTSPLLNDFDLKTARNVLVNIRTSKDENGLYARELKQISDCIEENMGNTDNFKRGIVYEEDGGKLNGDICITIIATGFSMSLLPQITKRDRGNVIVIDENYVSKTLKDSSEEEGEIVSLQTISVEEAGIQVIGKTTNTNIRKFHYSEPPLLAVNSGNNISELEDIPSIRRCNWTQPVDISR